MQGIIRETALTQKPGIQRLGCPSRLRLTGGNRHLPALLSFVIYRRQSSLDALGDCQSLSIDC